MGYPGGKGKCYQHIINLIPPHRRYIETHLGGGAVLRHKCPAPDDSIGIDIDARVIQSWTHNHGGLATFVTGDAVDVLKSRRFDGTEVVYSDPPYHPTTRRRRRVYKFDYTEADHERLLEQLLRLPCSVIVSGYDTPLYDSLLIGWNKRSFRAKTHADVRTESL